ncbi:CHAT domain-containing protein [Actinoplanes sp. SE50/110]|uniref:CHAT domain-containing protein n=1 Tax=Actinoplanes sp. (strain ATCC 31044 / CBS 674.73 / SE50/110) TaxID=134676 RepID=UPI001E3BA753|nr:CHAT domain-containing protein [Actinoplanes sp. SE50/110]
MEIFEQIPGSYELRLVAPDGAVKTRSVPRAVVDDLVETVDRYYTEHAIAPRVFGSTQLQDIGTRLAGFIDGDNGWLTPLLSPPGTTVRIVAGQRLRHLPWELLFDNGSFPAVDDRAALLTVRTRGTRQVHTDSPLPSNRPLRVLFMATSPEGVEPVLNYEAEEAAILAATARTGTALVVEESGTLEGLRFLFRDYGAGYFDVLHLSGHATVGADGEPVLLLENEFGGLHLATADQLVQAMAGHWPRLVFVSACLSASASTDDAPLSLGERLVDAGAPAVLGWALPVGDSAAIEFAAELYRNLADGQPIDAAVVAARRHLHRQKSPAWHLLRVYADDTPLDAMVTPLHTTGRAQLRIRHADQQFLDPRTMVSRVAARNRFVGRRRVIQRCLRTLRRPDSQALVLHGMGGLGKSSLASRLLERMPTHQHAVWYGRVDMSKFRELTDKVAFPTLTKHIEAMTLLSQDVVPLSVRLRYLLDANGPLGDLPCLFVFDDFEDGNLEQQDNGPVLSAAMAEILPALLGAIRDTGSTSRVIITSRYRFPAPTGSGLTVESLESLTDVEQVKKLANLPNLRPGSPLDQRIRVRAIQAAAGNPRLLDWLDLIVADATTEPDELLTAIEATADRFREEILAEKLLGSQPPELRRMLAKVNVVELPVPASTVTAMHDHPSADRHIERAVQLGLLEEGVDHDTRRPRYHVSNVLRPLIRPLLTDDEYVEACAAAAQSLYHLWVVEPTNREY